MPKQVKKAKKDESAPPPAERPSYKGIAKRVRTYLAEREATIPELMAALDLTEDAVLHALRRLGKSKKGTLRSGMVELRPCWWWEPEDGAR